MWLRKYAPKNLDEIIGQNKQLEQIQAWLEKPKKALLVYGPPGVGKTTTAHAIATAMDWELVEMNASDFRNDEGVRAKLIQAGLQASLFKKSKLLVVDEIDGLFRADYGGTKALVELIKTSRFPIFMTCNDNWAGPVRQLSPYSVQVQFNRLRMSSIVKKLAWICEKEKIKCERAVLLQLAESRDMRAAIMDLEAVAAGKTEVTVDDLGVLGARDQERSVFEALRDIFKTNDIWQARRALDGLDKDFSEMMHWIDENIPLEYESLTEINAAYEALSRADVLRGRIMRRQDWSLFSYAIEMMTIGVSSAKKQVYHKYTSYRPPSWLQRLGRTKFERATRNGLLKKIGKVTHCSKKRAGSYLPIIKAMLDKGTAPFELSDAEIKLLS
ncbi:MAG: replication factor C large subunit [Candidatus Altiarchaeota archaeon]|nr:replication factor C large subunit [Candidatus Altiarchaeota archaeon]